MRAPVHAFAAIRTGSWQDCCCWLLAAGRGRCLWRSVHHANIYTAHSCRVIVISALCQHAAPVCVWAACPAILCIIPAAMPAQVAEFWHEVELATNMRQQGMFAAVNAHLERLARAVDDVVGGLLALRLEPVLVRMEPPSAAEFHSSLQQLFEKGEPPFVALAAALTSPLPDSHVHLPVPMSGLSSF